MKKLLILLFCVSFCAVTGAAAPREKMYFNHLSAKDGLSQNLARTILQDNQGFIWIGTKDGLNRFDGQEIKVFRHEISNPFSIGCNYISSLFQNDDGHIWVGTEKGLYIYSPEYERFEPFIQESPSGRQVSGDIVSIRKDDAGRIWIAEIRGGLFCYYSGDNKLECYPYEELFPDPLTVRSMEIDKGGNIWVGDFGHGLMRLSQDRKRLVPLQLPDSGSKQEHYVNSVIRGPGNTLLIGYWGSGVKSLDLDAMRYRSILSTDEAGEAIYCRTLTYSEDGRLFAGTESGLFVYDLDNCRLTSHFRASEQDKYSLSDKAVHAVYIDREGGVWVGTYYGGVDYYRQMAPSVRKYYPTGKPDGLSGKRVHQFCMDGDGMIWITTSDGGLNRFNPGTETFQWFDPSRDFPNIPCLCRVGDELWAGTNPNGIVIIDPRNQCVKRRINKSDGEGSIRDNSVFAITRSKDGSVYVGTYFGIDRFDPLSRHFTPVEGIPAIYVSSIYEDSHGTLWVGTSKGVFKKTHADSGWKHYVRVASEESSLPGDKIKSICEDSRGIIWILTNGSGFCRYNPESDNFKRYDQTDGLPNDVVFRMEEDEKGLLWLSTNDGLAAFDPIREQFRVFTMEDGLLCDQYNDRSSFRTEDGTIYFGGIEGFVAFKPSEITAECPSPTAVLSDFSILGTPVRIGVPGSPMQRSLPYLDRLSLKHNQNSFSFKVCTFNYYNSTYGRVLCRLEGTDEEWHPLEGSQYVRYAGLNPGQYRFVVKDAAPEGGDRELTSLRIRIRPPWYGTIPAKLFYYLLGLGLLAFALWAIRRHNEDVYQKRLREIEQESERALHESQLQFFTNIAHEIRTPVTLISGPLDNVLQHGNMDPETVEDLGLVKANASKLLSLVNQLLDFRKIEHSGVALRYNRCNVSALLRETLAGFQYMLQERSISCSSDLPEEDLYAIVDEDAVKTILTNLINNGIKYADGVLDVSLARNGDRLVIRTRNDGLLIPPDMRDSIFKPFVRVGSDRERTVPGTGLGLTFSRTLSEAHGGTLTVEEDDEWNVFRLELPLEHALDSREENSASGKASRGETPAPGTEDHRPVILLVEDQGDLLEFVRRGLSKTYQVLTAPDGMDAAALLETKTVDLIVSDVMMPRMDGFELCRTVKSDIRFSHIPVILLTAMTDDKSKVSGLELGADSYIEKPFSMEVLKAGIASLLLNRANMRKAFANSPFFPVTSAVVSQTDKKFAEQVYAIIAENYSNTEFRMDDIASRLNMSRATFYRKIQGVLDMSPNDLLRLERLKRAAHLLRDNNLRINEVCYMTGFSSPSYFAKCFQQQFGMSPKEFVESAGKERIGPASLG